MEDLDCWIPPNPLGPPLYRSHSEYTAGFQSPAINPVVGAVWDAMKANDASPV